MTAQPPVEVEIHEPPEGHKPARTRFQRYRFLLVIALFVSAYLLVWAFDLQGHLSKQAITDLVQSAGAWGFFLYVAAFTVGSLLHVPGSVFVAVAVSVFERFWGAGAAFIGAVTAVNISFLVVRGVGGRALEGVTRPRMKKILARLDARPIWTVILLRTVFWMSPPVNYALAMTRMKFRDYLIGSTIGLFGPIMFATYALDRLLKLVW